MNEKWNFSAFAKSEKDKIKVDRNKGVIYGISLCTAGEAQGHGVYIDESFIQDVARLGQEKKLGLKARFGHPNMCGTALGTFIGRYKNIKTNEAQTQAFGDLYLSNDAKVTPNGDLYEYVLQMAENNPDMFGSSIAFSVGGCYRKDQETGEKIKVTDEEARSGEFEKLYVEINKLFACDLVDEPAANDGLFSAFSTNTIAGQVSEFFDKNPQALNMLLDSPEILNAIKEHGDKIDEFVEKYNKTKKECKMKEKTATPESVENLEVENIQTETETNDQPAAPESAPEEDVEKKDEEQEAPMEIKEEAFEMTAEDFSKIRSEFGDYIACEMAEKGGSYNDALQIAFNNAQAEIKALREEIKVLREAKGGQPVKLNVEQKTKKPLIRIAGR